MDRGGRCGIAASCRALSSKRPSRLGATIDIPWIIASEDEPWTMALAAPVAAHLRKSGPSPLVMAITSPPTREAEWLLSLAPGRRPIVLATSDPLKLGATLQKRSPELLQIGSDPSAGQRDGGEAVLEPFARSRRGDGR